ncbi:unnamed protein product, partial [Effrenium voratum]
MGECSRCHVDGYRNPEVRISSGLCGCSLCGRCLIGLKKTCPGCGRPARTDDFSEGPRESREVDREMKVRRQIKEIYCKEQRDFSNSEEWDEYLMLREDIIYKLVNSSKEEVLETWRQVDRYKAQHLAEIRQKQTARPKEVLEKVAAVITAEGDFAGRVNANWAEAKFQHPLQDQYNSLLKELPQSPGHILGAGGDSPMAPQPLLGDGRGGETGDAALRLRSGGGQLDVGLQKARYFFFSDLARYWKYSMWCQNESQATQWQIKSTEQKQEMLAADIAKATAEMAAASMHLAEIAQYESTDEADLKAATLLREKESADFKALELELVEGIRTTQAAQAKLEQDILAAGGEVKANGA